MKLTILPKTTTGKWSMWLAVSFIVLIWIKIQFFFPLPVFAIAALGLTGFILSFIAIFKGKDRFILVLLPILSGLIIIFWTSAELVYPH
jgi:hypothetical protein